MLFTLKWSLSVLGWEISPMKSYGYHGRTQWGLCTIYTYIETIKQTAQFDKKKHAFVIGPFFHCKTFVPRRARLWWPSWAHSRCGTRVHLNLSVKTQAFRTNDEGAPSSSTPQLWAPPHSNHQLFWPLSPHLSLAWLNLLTLTFAPYLPPPPCNWCSHPHLQSCSMLHLGTNWWSLLWGSPGSVVRTWPHIGALSRAGLSRLPSEATPFPTTSLSHVSDPPAYSSIE